MLKEIFEQPTAARETILGRVSQDTGKVFLEEMKITDAQLRGGRAGHDPRVRHVVARGAGRQVPDRAAGARAGRGRLRLGVPLPQPDRRRRTRWRSSSRSRARRPTRSRRCARRSTAARAASPICNVVGSMATRETDGTIYTHAGPEIGVASTKAFTSQLVALLPARRCGSARRAARCRPRRPSRTSTRCCSCRCCSSRR